MRALVPGLAAALAASCAAAPAPPSRAAAAPVAPATASAAPPAPPSPPTPPATPIAGAYRDTAARIVEAALAQEGSWAKLAHLTDRIGHRLSGSEGLERAVAWAAEAMRADGHENVRAEKVRVPHWVRGEESAEILAPVRRPMPILALGGSVGTPRRGVAGEVLVVSSLDELDARGAEARGRIVLFNQVMPRYRPSAPPRYGETVPIRVSGPARAARHGAIAALVRSVTAHSLRTPHTGVTVYQEGVARIPAAAVTLEDADLLARLAAAGPVRVRLALGARTLPDAESANVIAELVGRERPGEVVVIGGHLDSWDVGQGAHDDGAGCVTAMQALAVLRGLALRPRRTIRVVLFTNEENGLRGGRAYAEAHAAEDHVAAIEADSGGYAPRGYSVQGGPDALARAYDLVTLLAPLGAASAEAGGGGADIAPLGERGVPLLGHLTDPSRYFDVHHTHADTLDKVDPAELRANVAAMAVAAYVIADMPERLGASGGRAREAPAAPAASDR